ncbi:MAG TPA: mannose-6-phosphate isomerase, class I [Streptosporangiaceae bacterium]|nr:mannose-6-phosphate isomerase, class I [Streptosporangiaceae bacterium]
MELLQPVILPYAWGSRHGIAELQGRPSPTAEPEAELWMGAHPSAPSVVRRNGQRTTLEAVIAADPVAELGPATVARFGTRLPFLLKVLSAEAALSIQLHPSRAQAEAGFRAESERGLLPGDPARNYVDDWPKPELLCALTPFEALAGLRTPQDAAALLRALGVDQLKPVAAELDGAAGERVPAQALASILEWPESGRAELTGAALAACALLASADGPYRDACAAAVRESANHPGDLGLVAMLLMRHAVLKPGQALFMPAGGLHAYLRGTGIELLANSDNVIRAGLTGKHVDVPELLKLLDPDAQVPVILPRPLAEGIDVYETPAPEFRLYRLDLPGGLLTLPGAGPRILLCTEGSVVLRGASGQVRLARGESCFVSAADGAVTGTGQARAFLAGVGELS